MYLFLDDVRRPEHVNWKELPLIALRDWVIVCNYEQFTWCIEQFGIPEFVSYDNDLADICYTCANAETIPYDKYTEKTGYDCAKWLVNKCLDLGIPHPPFIVHSLNPVGAENITKYIANYNASLNT
jgi:hypothetical protein